MEDVGATVLLPQPFIRRKCVDQGLAARFAGIGDFQQPIRIEARHDERCALVGERLHRRNRIVILTNQFVEQRITLVEEAARRIVVFDRQLPAGQTIVGGRHIDQ